MFQQVLRKATAGVIFIIKEAPEYSQFDQDDVLIGVYGPSDMAFFTAEELGLIKQVGRCWILTELGRELKSHLQGVKKLEHA